MVLFFIGRHIILYRNQYLTLIVKFNSKLSLNSETNYNKQKDYNNFKSNLFEISHIQYFRTKMDSQPQWLDIQDELYPDVVILKQVLFENLNDQYLIELCTEIIYNSFKRQIDLTQVVYRYFFENRSHFQVKPSEICNYEILIHDKHNNCYTSLGNFPHDVSYTLGEQFLSFDMLHLVVKLQQKSVEYKEISEISAQFSQLNPLNEASEKQSQVFQQVISSDEDRVQEEKSKSKARRTIKQILKIVAEWRKLIVTKGMSPFEAAQIVKMSKRSLQEYFNMIKLAEKYEFDFQSKMQYGFGQLRNFVKEKHQIKKNTKIQILQKFKQMKK